LQINACGHTVKLDARSVTLAELQGILQRRLQMDGQTFRLFDVNGTPLVNDCQMDRAIVQGQLPLSATLTDESVHYLEKFAHKANHAPCVEQIADMQSRVEKNDECVADIQKQLETQRLESQGMTEKLQVEFFKTVETEHDLASRETQGLIASIRMELIQAVENELDLASSELRHLSEQVNVLAQRMGGEFPLRVRAGMTGGRHKETSPKVDKSNGSAASETVSGSSLQKKLQGTEDDVQNIREMLNADRSAHRQDLANHLSLLQGLKSKIETEKTAREKFVEKHTRDVQTLNERVETVSKLTAEMAQGLKHTHDEIVDSLRLLQSQIDGEKCSREFSEERYLLGMQTIQHRIETIPKPSVESLPSHGVLLGLQSDTSRDSASMGFDPDPMHDQAATQERHIPELVRRVGEEDMRQDMGFRGDGEVSAAEISARFSEMEARCASIDSRMAEAASRQAASIDRLCDRQERMWHSVEGLRLLKSQVESERGLREAFEDRYALDFQSISDRLESCGSPPQLQR